MWAFWLAWRLPPRDFGPVLFIELARLAAICRSVATPVLPPVLDVFNTGGLIIFQREVFLPLS